MKEKTIITEIVNDFKGVSKEEWIEKITADLKGKSIDELFVTIDEDLVMEPFVHSEDIVHNDALPKYKNGWYSGVSLSYEDPVLLNHHILKNLKNGAEAIRIIVPDGMDPNLVYKDVIPQFIYNDLDFKNCEHEIPKWMAHLSQLSELDQIQYSLNLEDDSGIVNSNIISDLKGHIFTIEDQIESGVIKSLSAIAEKIITLFEKGIHPRNISIGMQADHHLIKTVSKIRSIKMIWANLLDHFKYDQMPVFIKASAGKALNPLEDNDQLIAAGNLAVGSILGGADLIYLLEDNHLSNEQSRLALNVQHLMKLESHLDKVNDPLAGSFVVEKLAQRISKIVWNTL